MLKVNLSDLIKILTFSGVIAVPSVLAAGADSIDVKNPNEFGKELFYNYKLGGLTFNFSDLVPSLYVNKLFNKLLSFYSNDNSNLAGATSDKPELNNQSNTPNSLKNKDLDITYIHNTFVDSIKQYVNARLESLDAEIDSKVDKSHLITVIDQYANYLFAERINTLAGELTSLKGRQDSTEDTIRTINTKVADLDTLYNQLNLENTIIHSRVSGLDKKVNVLSEQNTTNALLNYAAEFNSPDQATAREVYNHLAVLADININQNKFDVNDQIDAMNKAKVWFKYLDPELYNTLTDQDLLKVDNNFSNTKSQILLNKLVREMYVMDGAVSQSNAQIGGFNAEHVAISLTNRVLNSIDTNIIDLINIYERTADLNIRGDYSAVNTHLELARQSLDVFEQNVLNSDTFNFIRNGYAGMQQQVSERKYVLSNGDTLSVNTLSDHFMSNMINLNRADEFYLRALGCAGDSLNNAEAVTNLMTQDTDFFKFAMRHYLIDNVENLHKDLRNFDSIESYQTQLNEITERFNQYRQTTDDLKLFPEHTNRFSANVGAALNFGNGDKKNGIPNVRPGLEVSAEGVVYTHDKNLFKILARAKMAYEASVAGAENSEVLPSGDTITKKFQNDSSKLSAVGEVELEKMLSSNFSIGAGVGYGFTKETNQVTGGKVLMNGEPIASIRTGVKQDTYKNGLFAFFGGKYQLSKKVAVKGQIKVGNQKPTGSASVVYTF